MSSSRWSIAVLALVLAHLIWGLVRVPSRAVARRLDDIAAYRERGAAHYLFDDAALAGAEAIVWLREHVPTGRRVRWSGADRGAIEFASALLWPRLLVGDAPGAAPDEPQLLATPTALSIQGR